MTARCRLTPPRPYNRTRPTGPPTSPAIVTRRASREVLNCRLVSTPSTVASQGLTYCASAAANGRNQYAAPPEYAHRVVFALQLTMVPHATVLMLLVRARPAPPNSTRPVGATASVET